MGVECWGTDQVNGHVRCEISVVIDLHITVRIAHHADGARVQRVVVSEGIAADIDECLIARMAEPLIGVNWLKIDTVTLMEVADGVAGVRGGPGCLNSFSASISGASAGVRLPRGGAAY